MCFHFANHLPLPFRPLVFFFLVLRLTEAQARRVLGHGSLGQRGRVHHLPRRRGVSKGSGFAEGWGGNETETERNGKGERQEQIQREAEMRVLRVGTYVHLHVHGDKQIQYTTPCPRIAAAPGAPTSRRLDRCPAHADCVPSRDCAA